MLQILLVLQVVIALCMIALVLVQHGKGADMGASFGAGASSTVFGSSGSTPFLVKITIFFAVLYFANSLGIGYLTTQSKKASAKTGSSLLTKRSAAPAAPVKGIDAAALSAAVGSLPKASKNIPVTSSSTRPVATKEKEKS